MENPTIISYKQLHPDTVNLATAITGDTTLNELGAILTQMESEGAGHLHFRISSSLQTEIFRAIPDWVPRPHRLFLCLGIRSDNE